MFIKGKDKAKRVADAVRLEISSGKLSPGSRLSSFRELSSRFAVSIKTVQIALELLFAEGLVELRHGSGTYVRSLPLSTDSSIYFLVPSASHLAADHETSIMLRQLLYGMTQSAGSGQFVLPVPVSRSNAGDIFSHPEFIDWDMLSQIPPGANVFLSGEWYHPIIPFLLERAVRGVFLCRQYYVPDCPADFPKRIMDAGWSIVTLDRRSAMRRVISFLYQAGCQRIAAIKFYQNQPDHPFRQGFIEGVEAVGIPFQEKNFLECPPRYELHWEEMLVQLWEKTQFDALILCHPTLAETAYSVLTTRLKKKIPQDLSLICYRDLPLQQNLLPRLSTFDFPWADIGAEIVSIFNKSELWRENCRFQAQIIDRGSVRERSVKTQGVLSDNPILETTQCGYEMV